MLGLPQKTLEVLRHYLLKRQKEVEKNLKDVEEDDPATTPSLAESSEPGTDSWIAEVHTRTVVLRDQLRSLGVSIKSALSNIKKGTYGHCEKCGQQIEPRRLLAMPTATLCLSCSKKKR